MSAKATGATGAFDPALLTRLSPLERGRLLGDAPMLERILVAFLRSEVGKAGFERVVLGISGGVDSALAAALAVRAFGPSGVLGLFMPYATTHPDSARDAASVARALGIDLSTVEISVAIDAYFASRPDADRVRRGNKMARERMSILYDHSAAGGALVVGTSNKTELLLGYSTQWGDMASAVNPIGDLYKTQVWRLASHLGIPGAVVTKAPSADLWAGQTDEADLGMSYVEADQLLFLLVDARMRRREVEERGFEPELVERVVARIRRTQYKRRPPTIAKVSARTITSDFLYPRDWGS